MGIFGFNKEKGGEDAVLLVLAYLEDALRLRSPFQLKGPGRQDVAASLHSVNEDARTFQLTPRGPFKADKGDKVDFVLIHDGLRLGASTRAVEARPGTVTLQLPDALELMERRRQPRARINPKEGATLTALEDLFKGVGINAVLENISEGGARVRVEKAMTISTQKRLQLGSHLVVPGQSFVVVRLNKLPKCPPVMETRGRAVYLAHSPGGLVMGLAFEQVPPDVEGALRRFVTSRARPIPVILPPKTRRPKEESEEKKNEEKVEKVEKVDVPEPEIPAAQPLPPLAPALPDPVGPLAPKNDAERQNHLRLTLGPGFRARFLANGNPVPDGDMLDVSVDGCCLRLTPEGCRTLDAGMMLEGFHFTHKDLPNGVIQARVSWILGKNAGEGLPGEDRYRLVGVEFLELPPVIEEGLEAYIAWYIDEV